MGTNVIDLTLIGMDGQALQCIPLRLQAAFDELKVTSFSEWDINWICNINIRK